MDGKKLRDKKYDRILRRFRHGYHISPNIVDSVLYDCDSCFFCDTLVDGVLESHFEIPIDVIRLSDYRLEIGRNPFSKMLTRVKQEDTVVIVKVCSDHMGDPLEVKYHKGRIHELVFINHSY